MGEFLFSFPVWDLLGLSLWVGIFYQLWEVLSHRIFQYCLSLILSSPVILDG